jgi:DNA-binding MarR family transcriptional regulator
LEDRKWIRREANYKDKRIVKIFLTDLGKQKRDQARQGVLLFNQIVYDKIGAEKLGNFFEVLKSINGILEQDTGHVLDSLKSNG